MIYIGKARSLRDRVKSYFSVTKDAKIFDILKQTHDIDYILTGSEREASFLENNLIQQYQPRFNIRLKDDKSFPYLKLTVQDPYPGIYLTRRVEPDGARYFGPFSPAHQARKTIHLLNKYFGIRSCQENIPGKRKRPCLEYDINLCSAPCVNAVSLKEYSERVKNALLLLEGNVDELLKILKQKMKEAADYQEYEKASHWRDLILSLEQLKKKPVFISSKKEDKDIFGYSRKKIEAVLFIFFMRKGKVIESKGFRFKIEGNQSDKEALSANLFSIYRNRPYIPEKIYLPFLPDARNNILNELKTLSGKEVRIFIPKKGENAKFVNLANTNAKMILKKDPGTENPILSIQTLLNMDDLPTHIEGFDISNTQGSESVGSLVVFKNGHPDKREYRRYKINTVRGPNDVASLKEIIQRRYSRMLEEKKSLPDLILVDGGKGQLNTSRAALNHLGLGKIPVVALAKKEEILFSSEFRGGLRLDMTSLALKLFQNIRDEAHRFALRFHRKKRTQKSFSSILDEIPGIGEKRRSILLRHYKSIKAVYDAPFKELAELIGKKAAQSLANKIKMRKDSNT